MLKFTFVAIAVLVLLLAGLLAYASTRPDTFHVERSVTVQAPAEKVFALVDDFHQWEAWTPFDKDPAMKKTFSGSPRGEGARYAWEGNRQAGAGDITITRVLAPREVVFDLHMIRPFEGRNVGTLRLDPVGDGTKVTWSIDDRHGLLLKVIGVLVNLDQKIGADFEVGLARLKAIAEKDKRDNPSA